MPLFLSIQGPDLDPEGLFTNPWTVDDPAPESTIPNEWHACSPTPTICIAMSFDIPKSERSQDAAEIGAAPRPGQKDRQIDTNDGIIVL